MENVNTDIVATEIKRTINHWWIFLLIGGLLVAAGVWEFFQTSMTLADLRWLFVFLFIVSGILEIFFAFSNRRVVPSWGGFLGFAIIEVILGLILLAESSETAHIFAVYVGVWLLLRGVVFFLAAADAESLGFSSDWMWFVFAGLVTIGLGLSVFLDTQIGVWTVVRWTATAMICSGLFSLLLAYKLRKVRSNVKGVIREVKESKEHSGII